MLKAWVSKQVVKAFASSIDLNFKERVWFGANGRNKGRQRDEILTEEGYATNSDVHAIIERTSLRTAETPLRLIKKDLRGNKIDVEQGLLFDLLFDDPKETRFDKIQKAAINIKASGDLFIEFKTSLGYSKEDLEGNLIPSSMVIHRSGMVDLCINKDGEVEYYTINEYSGSYKVYPRYMLHVKLYDPSKFGITSNRGLSRLQAAYRVLFAANEIQTASASLFRNQGASSLLTDKTGALSDPENAKKLQDAVNKRIGGAEKAGQVTVTSADVAKIELGMSSKDLELLKSQPMKLRQLCTVFGVYSVDYNDPDGSTYNNVREGNKKSYINGVKPDLRLIVDSINKFVSKWERDIILEPDYSQIEELQGDQKEAVEKSKILSEGALSVLTDVNLSQNQKGIILREIWKIKEETVQELLKAA